MPAGARAAGNSLEDGNTGAFELFDFVGVVGKQPNFAKTESLQSFRREFVIAGIVGESEFPVCFHGIESSILQLVSLQLIDQSDSASFLRQVQQNSRWLAGDLPEGKFKLSAAVAALGREYVSCEALRMYANERRLPVARLTMLDGDRFFALIAAFDPKNLKPAKTGWQLCFCHDMGFHGLLFGLHRNLQL